MNCSMARHTASPICRNDGANNTQPTNAERITNTQYKGFIRTAYLFLSGSAELHRSRQNHHKQPETLTGLWSYRSERRTRQIPGGAPLWTSTRHDTYMVRPETRTANASPFIQTQCGGSFNLTPYGHLTLTIIYDMIKL